MNTNIRGASWLGVILGGLLLALCMSAPALAAGGYGELLRFGGKGTNNAGKAFEFAGEETHAFAVDTETGAVDVGDEKEEHSGNLRLQQYNANGAFEAEAIIKEPTKMPKGAPGLVGYEGFAIEPKAKRLYVLAVYKRFAEDKVDPSQEVAGALYALSTVPSGGKLVPAEGAGKEGLLGTVESLGAGSETQGSALLDPSGIAVDSATGDVIIMGIVDDGAAGLHTAVEHLGGSGAPLSSYVDPAEVAVVNKPDSPVVSAKGKLFFEQGDELLELPAAATSGSPEVVFDLSEPESLTTGPFVGELTSFGEGETGTGGGLSIVSEGGENEGRIVSFAEIHEMTETGELREERNGALDLKYVEEGEHVKVSEIGWTGGVPGEGEEEASASKEPVKPCEIGFARANPQVAASGAGKLYVLAPAWSEVIEFGPSGSGCPAAEEAPGGLQVTVDGKEIANPETSATVTLSARIVEGSVLSTKWIFDDGQQAEVVTSAGEQTQTAEVAHKFAKGGKLEVEAIIQTDDLATPEIKVKAVLNVIETGKTAPKVTGNPSSQTKLEGESATFQAAASGDPTPTVQWEISSDGGVDWTPLNGATSDALVVEDLQVGESGDEYRATFENGAGSAAKTTTATLTVESKKAQEEALKKAHEEEVHNREAAEVQAGAEAAARQKAEQEAAAAAVAKHAAEEAAKRKQEEAGKTGTPSGGEGSPRATVAAGSASVSGSGAVAVEVGCPVGVAQCTGTITLSTVSAASARAHHGASKKRALTLGSATFVVAGGHVGSVTVHLSSAARALLARAHVLQVHATIVAHNPSGGASTVASTLTLRAARSKARR
jgi:hypothetical protein